MPAPNEILAVLSRIATQAQGVALFWHAVLACALMAMASGWRPSARRFGVLSLAPVVSVSVLALTYGSLFNGATFALLALALLLAAGWSSHEPWAPVPAWSAAAGVLLIGFAWVYPHFLPHATWPAYLLAAPMGLVPCPTLALLIGLALWGKRPDSPAWSWLLAGAGFFYGAFGVLRLGVWLDVGLLLGVVALVVQLFVGSRHREEPPLRLINAAR